MMQRRFKRGLVAASALTILAAAMIHAGTSGGCARSNSSAQAPAPGSAEVAAQPGASTSAAPPVDEETYFPASKAGPFSPRKGKGVTK